MIMEDVFVPRSKARFGRQVLLTIEKLLYWSGLGYLYLKTQRPHGAVILTYHSIAAAANAVWIDPRNRISPETFERQMCFLAAYRNVISMNALLKAILERASLPAGSVVLTFDDGYRDNAEIAAPILQRYQLPALLYVPTGLVARGESAWADELYSLFRTRSKDTLRLINDGAATHDLRDPRARLTAYALISQELIVTDRRRRDALLASLVEQLAPRERPPRLTLSWDELRALRRHFPLFDLGVHSANHVDFTSQGRGVIEQELRECTADFKKEIGAQPEHFAYPYDRRNEETDRLVAAAGLRTAVGSGPDCFISTSHDPLDLPRVGATPSMSLFRFWTSGTYPDLPRRLFGRA